MKPVSRFWLAIVLVVTSSLALRVTSAVGETQTWDEATHIASGYAYLMHGDYRWNQEHPPLVKLMSALPLAFLGVRLPVGSEPWRTGDEVALGIEFLYHNRVPADPILLAARSMTILLSGLFLLALAWWARRRFGAAAALLAVTLCAFDPNLIAHGHYVTTDFPVTVFYFFSIVLWMEYLLHGTFRYLAAAALVFALAMVTKFSAVLLIPTLAGLYVVRWWQVPREFPLRRAALAAVTLTAVTVLLVSAVYWSETARSLQPGATPLADVVKHDNPVGEALFQAGTWFRLPAHAFLTGFGLVARHNAGGHHAYLLGKVSDAGWWYYFPVAFAVKSTLAALACAVILLFIGLRNARRWRELDFLWVALLAAPAFYFVFSMTSAINIGVRHILPVYPFLYVAAAVALSRLSAQRLALYGMVALGFLQIVECAAIAPNYLAFFNALVGGPDNGAKYLSDSNLDWGQDIKKLKSWMTRHRARTVWLAAFGPAPPDYYGVDWQPLPEPQDRIEWNRIDGFVVVGATRLSGSYDPAGRFARLQGREPVAKIGWSLYVYDFHQP